MIENISRIQCISELHRTVKREIEGRFYSDAFEYMDFQSSEVMCALPVDMSGWVAVIGDPESGSCEWICRLGGESPRYVSSNEGWGCMASALREALVYALG